MLALYRSGRQRPSLPTGRRGETLVEGLGIEPGVELRRLERAILDRDPALDVPMTAGPAQVTPGLRSRSNSFIGRRRELR